MSVAGHALSRVASGQIAHVPKQVGDGASALADNRADPNCQTTLESWLSKCYREGHQQWLRHTRQVDHYQTPFWSRRGNERIRRESFYAPRGCVATSIFAKLLAEVELRCFSIFLSSSLNALTNLVGFLAISDLPDAKSTSVKTTGEVIWHDLRSTLD